MDIATKLMDKKVNYEMGVTHNDEARESYSSRNLTSRFEIKDKNGLVLPEVVSEVLKRTKVRNMYVC